MRATRKELTSFYVGLVIFVFLLGVAGCSDQQATPANTATVTTTTAAPIDYDYHIEGLCAQLAYLQGLDNSSGYAITHAIITAGGPEDTLVQGFESGDICEGE